MTREEMAKLIDEWEYPNTAGMLGKNNKCPPVLKKQYRRFVEDVLGANTKEAFDAVRTLAGDKLAREQDKIHKKAIDDIINGRISEDEIPLSREERNGGIVLKNIPEQYANILGFLMYLNETWDWKYEGEKRTKGETIRMCILHMKDAQKRAPGTPFFVAVESEHGSHCIIDNDEEKNMIFIAMFLTDYAKNGCAGSHYDAEKTYSFLFDNIQKDIDSVKASDYTVFDSAAEATEPLREFMKIPGLRRKNVSEDNPQPDKFRELASKHPEIQEMADKEARHTVSDLSDSIEDSEFNDGHMTMICAAQTLDGQNSIIGEPSQIRYLQLVRKALLCVMHKALHESGYGHFPEAYVAATCEAYRDILHSLK